MRGMAATLLALMLACAPAGAAAPVRPERIASLNLCADELVLRLADPGQVASVTYLAGDPFGANVADLARRVPVNRGLAEEIVGLKPDLVIVGAFTTRTTTAMLRRLSLPVLELGVPQSLAEAYAQIREVAAAIGAAERGEAMVRQMEEAFARLPAPQRPVRAIVLRPNGFTAGRGTLPDEIMARAGLENLAARLSTDRLGQLALEEIARAQPELLVVNGGEGAPASLADAVLHHPVLAPYLRAPRSVHLPARLWTCAGPGLAEAAERLSAAAEAVRQAPDSAGPRAGLAAPEARP